MKTKQIISLISLTALLFLIGCSKGSSGGGVIITPTELAPKIVQFSVTPTSVDFNGSFTAKWSIQNFTSGTLNGEKIAATGSKKFSNVIANTVVTLFAKNITKTVTSSKTVTVGEEKAPTLDVNLTSLDSMPYPYHTNSVTVSWNTTNATKVTVNGTEVADVNGSKVYENMVKDTTVTIIATNVNKTVTVTKTLTIGDWTTSTFGLLTHEHWIFKATGYLTDSINGQPQFHMYKDSEIDPILWTNTYYYTTDGRYKIYGTDINGNTNQLLGDFKYTIIKNADGSYSVKIDGGNLFDIILLDENTMVLYEHTTEYYDSNGDGNLDASRPTLSEDDFTRQSG